MCAAGCGPGRLPLLGRLLAGQLQPGRPGQVEREQHAGAAQRGAGGPGQYRGILLLPAVLYSPVLQVSWGHLVADPHCVDRFILQVWDTRPRLVRYIYNSSAAERAVVPAPPCTRLQVQVGNSRTASR